MDPRTGLGCGARQPLREFEGMEMPGFGIAAAAEISVGADRGGELVALDPVDGGVAIVAFELVDIGSVVRDQSVLVRRLDQARTPFAVDLVAGDQPLDQALGFFRKRPEVMRVIDAEPRLEPGLVAPLPGMELTAIPSGGPPTDALGLD